MSTPALPRQRARVGLPGAALIAVGIAWLAVAGMIAVVIRLQVPTPSELLRDVADQRALWITANVILIVQQVALIGAAPLLVGAGGAPAAGMVRGLLAMTGGALVASGVLHGVLGAHLASKVTDGTLSDALVLDAELVHALGDTCWFVGVGAMIATTALLAWSTWRSWPALARVGAGAVVVNLLQFGWFFDRAFGVFAAPGTALQVVWFVVAARQWHRPAVAGVDV